MERNKTGLRIDRLRAECNETQQQLADAIGVKRETINQWISGTRQIKARDIIKLSEHFGVTSDYILGISENRSTNENVQEVTAYTGLTDSAAETLHEIKTSGSGTEKLILDLLNRVLSDPQRPALFSNMEQYIKADGAAGADTITMRSGTVLPVGELYNEFLIQSIRAALDEYRNKESGIVETTVYTVEHISMEGKNG